MKILFLCFVFMQFSFCSQKKQDKQELRFKSKKEYENVMIQSHRVFLDHEKARIQQFIDSTGKEFDSTGTGLRYHIYKHGKGDTLKIGDVAIIKYKLSLLDGTEVYQTDKKRLQEFTVDYDNVESGLNEGIKYMNIGDQAIMILPAHLAFGVTGDQAKIPPQSTLVYDLKLVSKK